MTTEEIGKLQSERDNAVFHAELANQFRLEAQQQNAKLRAALEHTICVSCHYSIGWQGVHTAERNAKYGTLNWRTCPTCRDARAALADPQQGAAIDRSSE